MMSRKLSRLVVATGLLFILFPVLFVASIWIPAVHYRHRAEQLLTVTKTLTPGKTTEAQAHEAFRPFQNLYLQGEESVAGKPNAAFDEYAIDNYPEWPQKIAPHLPDSVNRHIWPLYYTSFIVMPRYRAGVLSELTMEEMQEHPDNPHPYMASVRILARHFEADDVGLPQDFQGYSLSPYTQWSEDADGHRKGNAWIIRQYISLDERATPQQHSDSTNFQLRCFTALRPCNDARMLLPTTAVPQDE